MRTNRWDFRRWARGAALTLAVLGAPALTGCSDFLEVTNPGAIENPALENVAYLQLMHDGVLGEFQPAVAWTALFSGMFTDELRVHHTFSENYEIDERRVGPANATAYMAVFAGLHRARFMADSIASRYRNLLGDTVQNDMRYARMVAMGAYSWLLLGENVCETRINAQGEPLQPADLFQGAIERFDLAITAAQQAKVAAGRITTPAQRDLAIARADSILNMARVGAARAALNLGDNARAISYAQAVTPAYVDYDNKGFRYDLNYAQVATSPERRHALPYYEFISAGGSWVSLTGTGFENLNDPRVPHEDPAAPGAPTVSGGGQYAVPNAPASFDVWDGTVTGARFKGTGKMRLASAIEAAYILAEAQGPTPANIDFLNEQRGVGGQAPLVNPSLDEYRAALREQRAREFFIDGHRLGDLRRYEAQYNIDLWPTGEMYGTGRFFGDEKCWPVPVTEQ